MSAQHTPGPWRARSHEFDRYSAMWHALEEPLTRGGLTFWTVDSTPDGSGPVFAAWAGNGPQAEANARLIAAAPDLYEAVKALLTDVIASESGVPQSESLDALEDAIAKAEGREP